MEENKVKSWRSGFKFTLAAMLVCLGIFYASYIEALIFNSGMSDFNTNLIKPALQILCYLVFGILAFVFIAKGKCPGLFFKLGLLIAPLSRISADISSLIEFSNSALDLTHYSIELTVLGLLVLFVVFAIFNVAGKKKLWAILGISLAISFNLFNLIGYMDIKLDFKDYITTYLFQLILVVYCALYLALVIKSEGCSCGKCACQKEETK